MRRRLGHARRASRGGQERRQRRGARLRAQERVHGRRAQLPGARGGKGLAGAANDREPRRAGPCCPQCPSPRELARPPKPAVWLELRLFEGLNAWRRSACCTLFRAREREPAASLAAATVAAAAAPPGLDNKKDGMDLAAAMELLACLIPGRGA